MTSSLFPHACDTGMGRVVVHGLPYDPTLDHLNLINTLIADGVLEVSASQAPECFGFDVPF